MSTGVVSWPRPRLGGADFVVGCEGNSRPTAVGELVDEEVDLHWGQCMGADFRVAPTSGRPAAVRLTTMVGVGDAGVADTMEARLAGARRRHEAQEFGDLPWAVVEAGIRSVWATEHPPSQPASPRPVNTEGGVDVGVNARSGQVGSSAGGTSRQRAAPVVDPP
ncbi:unnamed protein product [Closterium sp. Naga37s-1]|nr:unnamed protein product [Closterium sp. Naga37s-1]